MGSGISGGPSHVFVFLLSAASLTLAASALGSMSSIAVSYGENGPVFCALVHDGSHLVRCFGTDPSIVYGTPSRLPMLALTAGDSFVCGLLLDSSQPYCWGSNFYVEMGVPQPMEEGAAYSQISAGDHHLCGIRKPRRELQTTGSVIDCWGYNMTTSLKFDDDVRSITAGSLFNCGLHVQNLTAMCWGDETGSNILGLTPKNLRFRSISAGGYHVCGILENFRVFCWGRSLAVQEDIDMAPPDPMISVVGGRFHSCGIKSVDHEILCWGFQLRNSISPPKNTKLYQIAAGDYFTCGVVADSSLNPLCWGTGGPWSIPMAAAPGICNANPCGPGFFEFSHFSLPDKLCKPANSRVCLPCSNGCPEGTYLVSSCNSTLDQICEFNCTNCMGKKKMTAQNLPSIRLPIFISELIFGLVLVCSVSLIACLYVRYKLQKCKCGETEIKTVKNQLKAVKNESRSFHNELVKVQTELEEMKIHRALMFSFEELERATGGFSEESQIGKGSFSCVFKGVLKDGTIVAVKRAVKAADLKKNSREFRTELDLLSRLNHAHLLNLLGYCEEGGERLLVYEFMAHGSLYQHLHGNDRESFDWIRRVTIAVQAARGIEYLHGYACPPVIHRDIKSSNILIDEEHNARVSDFGLSLLGPTDSSSPLSELPAGTLGYLDPEYYRLHYLTTKSDVYSFGVLLLEILSGRKAIDMQFEEGNIVEWAVPLIKAENIAAVLDPVLEPPAEQEALKKIATVAYKCVRMRGKDRPSMDQVTTALERGLALLMGSQCNDLPILPTEVVLGSNRLHKKPSLRSSTLSCSENDMVDSEDQRFEYRAPSWITFPSVTSSQRRKSSVSEGDVDAVKNSEGRSLRCLEEEIGPGSPHEELFLQHNF